MHWEFPWIGTCVGKEGPPGGKKELQCVVKRRARPAGGGRLGALRRAELRIRALRGPLRAGAGAAPNRPVFKQFQPAPSPRA